MRTPIELPIYLQPTVAMEVRPLEPELVVRFARASVPPPVIPEPVAYPQFRTHKRRYEHALSLAALVVIVGIAALSWSVAM